MIYRNLKTGAVINTPCKISGKDWQETAPAGFPLKEKEVVPEETTEEPAKEKAEAEAPKEEPKEEKKATKGATIKPKKGK